MRINRIKIHNFKSIYDDLEIDFNDVRGFWKLTGPVGSGKTSIGEAIVFGLFGTVTGKSNESLISWGEKHTIIEMWCVSKGYNIYIKREINRYGQSPIYVTIDGEELIFTNKRDGQLQLESEYFDISRTTIELLCIISFNNFKSLATLNASDTKKFIDQVLGFSILTDYAEECKELRRSSFLEGQQLMKQIDSNNDQINKIRELTNIEHIEGDIQETQQETLKIITKREEVCEEWSNKIQEQRDILTEKQSKLSQIKTLGGQLKKEIDFIKKGTCPTCGAKIDQTHLKDKELERQLLVEQYKDCDNEIKSIQLNLKQLEQSKKDDDVKIKNELIEKRNLVILLKEQEKRYNINIDAIADLEKKNQELQEQVETCYVNDEQWSELNDILSNDIRVKILSSFIPTLNKNILKYTQQLQIPYIISFDTAFKCNINIYGIDTPIPVSSLSTGQLKTVDICIILGVLSTITSNISFNILFLDELISNAHKELRDDICCVLKQNLHPDQTIFLISHTDVEQRYFDGEINVKLQYIDEAHRKSVCEILPTTPCGD